MVDFNKWIMLVSLCEFLTIVKYFEAESLSGVRGLEEEAVGEHALLRSRVTVLHLPAPRPRSLCRPVCEVCARCV